MKWLLALTAAVGLVLTPFVTYAEYATSGDSKAPVAPALVREGDLAVSLADALKVGKADSEAMAEDSLNALGIAPANGWVSDYPVTPDIVGELNDRVGKAADFNKVKMSRDDALSAYQGVLDRYGLKVLVASDGDVTDAESAPTPDDYADTDVSSYYDDNGPPPVSYYPPPWDYYYMYSWVPCGFWWGVTFFPGFFVLDDFSVIVIDRDHHRRGDGDHDADDVKVVSNHVRGSDGKTRLIDPAGRREGRTVASAKEFMHAGRGAGGKAFDKAGGGRGILDRNVARERGVAREGTGNKAVTTRTGGGDKAFVSGAGRIKEPSGPREAVSRGSDEKAFSGGRGGGERAFSGGGHMGGGGERASGGGGGHMGGGFGGGGHFGGGGGCSGRHC